MSKIARIFSAATLGLDSFLVEVEVDIGAGLPSFTIVGLGDKAIDESKERIRAAIKNCGIFFPQHRLTVNLAPADIKKEGPSFDLPMAIGILLADEQFERVRDFKESIFVGELSLDGKLRHVNGVLSIVMFAYQKGFKQIFVPEVNAQEAAMVEGIEIKPVKTLGQLVKHLRGEELIPEYKVDSQSSHNNDILQEFDFAYIAGQEQAKRALEIAAAGNHNILLSGPPGSGKTLLARSLPTILPDMNQEELIDVMRIYSVAGLLTDPKNLYRRPFRSPHHTTSSVAIVGGGSWPKPGEISLSHRGILFLDEFPEFPRSVLESLRQPLEDGVVTVSRATGSLTFPAQFLLIAAQNPCPCGYFSDPEKHCTCTPTQIIKYQKKVSGPILDRIDIHLEVPRVKYEKLAQANQAELEQSRAVKDRVAKAREIQEERFQGRMARTNSEMKSKDIKDFCKLDKEAEKLLHQAVDSLKLSARVYHRLLKLSQTIADLEGKDQIEASHIAEALRYRPKEKTY